MENRAIHPRLSTESTSSDEVYSSSGDESTGIKRFKIKPIQEVSLMRKYLRLIRSGKKTIEGRCASNTYSNLQQGDILKFICNTDKKDWILCEVERISQYPTFLSMLVNEGYEKCIPGSGDLSNALAVYTMIPGYPEKEKEFGVVGIQVNVLQDYYI